jgi:hypothetical protein
VLNKGDKPYTTKEIQQKLEKQWKTTASWTMLSLGRGYYEFFFTSELVIRHREFEARGFYDSLTGLRNVMLINGGIRMLRCGYV